MTEQEIIAKVRAVLNEIGKEENFTLLTEDTVKIDEYIKSSIPEAVLLVQQNSPVRCVNKKSGVGTVDALSVENGASILPLPDDFVSLIAVKLSSWRRICASMHDMNSEEYKWQCNSYTVNGVNKPVCIYGYASNGVQSLLLYPSDASNPILEMFVYEARYSSADGLGLEDGDPLLGAICYMAASLVYSIFENENSAKALRAIALSLIPK